MFASGRLIVAANRTNVRLRQDPISGPEICKPNKCSHADTAADIVPHAQPEDKSRDRNQNTRKGSGTGTARNAREPHKTRPESILYAKTHKCMYKSLMRLKRNILEYATNTIIQCSAMDPEEMQTGTAKPAGHPEPETETNLQTGRRAQDPRRLHPETFTRSA